MKSLILLLLPVWLCTACAALPGEEKAFAVALCAEKEQGEWRIHGRVPTYQSGGGYTTVTGKGNSFTEALSDMDAAAPMRINLSQLRLMVAEAELAATGELQEVLRVLSDRRDIRMQCAVALSDAPMYAVAEALMPAAGSRLSKALDLMLEARAEQGEILPAQLADVLRMGERQSPVLIALRLEGEEIRLSGGYTLNGLPLTADETELLSLLLGHAKSLQMSLPGGSAEVRDACAKTCLSENQSTARVELTLTVTAAALTECELEQALIGELLPLLTKLSVAGCDALGLGRRAILGCGNMAEWDALDWPEKYRGIRWEVAVGVDEPA